MVEKEVFSSMDEYIVSRLCTILGEKGISYIRKDGGAESYINIVHGQDMLSQKKIFVKEDDFEKARELIDFLEIKEENEEENKPKALKVIRVEDEFGYGKYHAIKIISGILAGTTFVFLFIFLMARIILKV